MLGIVLAISVISAILLLIRYKAVKSRMKTALRYNFVNENFHKARDYFSKEDEQGNIEATIYLARLYHSGLRGQEPDAQRALKYYRKAVFQGVYYCLLNIGDIYNYGLGEIAPNPPKARRYYTQLIQLCERGNSELDAFYLNEARERLATIEAAFAPGGFFYDTGFAAREQADTEQREQRDLGTEIGIGIAQILERARERNHNRRFQRQHVRAIRRRDHRLENRTALDNPAVVHNDSQNVHDNILNKTILNSINELKRDTSLRISAQDAVRQLRQIAAQSGSNSKKRENAQRTLNSLSTTPVGQSQMSQLDLLRLVWNRIQGYKNPEKKRVATENLIDELAESSEHGITVCATGVFNRIIDSLNKVDSKVEIRPKWSLNREMMESASRMRQQMTEDADTATQAALSEMNPTEQQAQMIEDFDTNLKANLRQKFRNDYVQSGLLTEDALEKEISNWIDHI